MEEMNSPSHPSLKNDMFSAAVLFSQSVFNSEVNVLSHAVPQSPL